MSTNPTDLRTFGTHEDVLGRVRTAGAVTISPEVFESMFLAPKMPVTGNLRSTFGNPTPVALAGFLLCTTPLSMVLFGWKNSGGFGAAEVGVFFFFGGLLLTLAGIGEFLLGNTFPQIVFLSFGAFYFTFGATLVPAFNAYGHYSSTSNPADGLNAPMFFNSYAFLLISMILLSAVFCVASIRTNIVFFLIFLLLIVTFSCLAASFFAFGRGDVVAGTTLQHAGAGTLFVLSLCGWYIFTALVLMSVDFPVLLPLGDLSTVVKGRGDREKVKSEKATV